MTVLFFFSELREKKGDLRKIVKEKRSAFNVTVRGIQSASKNTIARHTKVFSDPVVLQLKRLSYQISSGHERIGSSRAIN